VAKRKTEIDLDAMLRLAAILPIRERPTHFNGQPITWWGRNERDELRVAIEAAKRNPSLSAGVAVGVAWASLLHCILREPVGRKGGQAMKDKAGPRHEAWANGLIDLRRRFPEKNHEWYCHRLARDLAKAHKEGQTGGLPRDWFVNSKGSAYSGESIVKAIPAKAVPQIR
jgi:hypothetical protein